MSAIVHSLMLSMVKQVAVVVQKIPVSCHHWENSRNVFSTYVLYMQRICTHLVNCLL